MRLSASAEPARRFTHTRWRLGPGAGPHVGACRDVGNEFGMKFGSVIRVLTLKRTGSARAHAHDTIRAPEPLAIWPQRPAGRTHKPSLMATCSLSQQRTPNLCISLGMTLNRMMTSPAGSVSSRNRSADEAITSRCFNRGAPPRKKAARRGAIGGTGGQRGAGGGDACPCARDEERARRLVGEWRARRT